MASTPKAIHIEPGSELARVLDEALEAGAVLEQGGVRYRVIRVEVETSQDQAGQTAEEPDALLSIIGIGESRETTDIASHKQEYLADAADAYRRQ